MRRITLLLPPMITPCSTLLTTLLFPVLFPAIRRTSLSRMAPSYASFLLPTLDCRELSFRRFRRRHQHHSLQRRFFCHDRSRLRISIRFCAGSPSLIVSIPRILHSLVSHVMETNSSHRLVEAIICTAWPARAM